MIVFSFFLLGTLLLTLQTTLLHLLPEWVGRPNLIFLLVVYLAVHMDLYKGAVLALLFGLIMDIFSGIFLGLHPVIYLLLFFSLKGLSRHLAIMEPLHQVPMVAVSYLFSTSGIFIFTTILAPENPLEWAWGTVLLELLILCVICIPCFHFFHGISQLLTTTQTKSFFSRSKTGNRFKV